MPRRYLDQQTRDFLESALLTRWINEFDSPRPDEIEAIATSVGLKEPGTLLVELDDETIADPTALSEALARSGKWQPAVRLLPDRPVTETEHRRLLDAFGSQALAPLEIGALPDRLVILLKGALPRAYGPFHLLSALHRNGSALAYGDEASLLRDGTESEHWFKPPRHSPLLARQGNLLGRMVAVDLGRVPNRQELARDLLAPTADRRRILAELAFALHDEQVSHVPRLCLVNTRPAAPLLALPSFPLPEPLPLVSIIIPTRNAWPLLSRCLASLDQTDWPQDRLEIIVVDNGSTDLDCLEGLKTRESAGRIRLIRHDEKFNYSRINNIAARQARGEILVLLNNDTEALRPDWLKAMAKLALQDGVGAVGPKLLYEDRTVQHAGVVLGMHGGAVHEFVGLAEDEGGYQGLALATREVSAVTAACLAIRREVFECVGGLNESFEVAFNDVVLCCDLLAAGYRNIYLAEPLFLHLESKTRGSNTTPEKLKREQDECRRAIAIYPELFTTDPYYSTNLSLDVFFRPAFPPRRVRA
ncbi:glycosyltransferase family 2 protein [Tabrizicola sp. J26]|uniref:glycosyltransferase family 2 protein n=1 Tax=Alitabrizicola rongguiensis TaxID=2909234 RepID=UPI001F35837B|nr:glycosyltransferase family 2 protein [Tabrizicola rongguiensis]MCF1708565.1 glycosyltransferase family 2 protein [Tabrizicola rongguiensis]